MPKSSNPYLDLMDDSEPEKTIEKHHSDQSAKQIEPVILNEASKNPYLDLMENAEPEKDYSIGSLPSVLSGGIGGSKEVASRAAEMIAGAPLGSVSEVNSLMNPTKAVMSPEIAARMAIEARTPPAPEIPAPAVQKAIPNSSGDAWLKNYANIEKPGFTGGVPEGAQAYQRGKPSGTITSKVFKKHGNMPLTIGGFSAQQALAEDELLTKIRNDLYAHEMQKKAAEAARQQAELRAAQVEKDVASTSKASKIAGPLSTAGKLLGAAGIGAGAYDTYMRNKNEDTTGALISGLGTVASAAAPFLASAGVLPVASIAAPMYLMARDRYKYLNKNPEEGNMGGLLDEAYDVMGNRTR
jgi:hypothetical protein